MVGESPEALNLDLKLLERLRREEKYLQVNYLQEVQELFHIKSEVLNITAAIT